LRRGLLLTVLAAAAAGLGVSVYLTAVHAHSAALICSTTGVIDCERVLTSAYGTILGSPVPTAAAGILWFLVSGALAAQRLRSGDARLGRLQLAWGGLGLLAILYLVYVEIDVVGAICAWCTAAHALVLVSLLAVLTLEFGAGGRAPARR
jgi:uncharacterized membrane protein